MRIFVYLFIYNKDHKDHRFYALVQDRGKSIS